MYVAPDVVHDAFYIHLHTTTIAMRLQGFDKRCTFQTELKQNTPFQDDVSEVAKFSSFYSTEL